MRRDSGRSRAPGPGEEVVILPCGHEIAAPIGTLVPALAGAILAHQDACATTPDEPAWARGEAEGAYLDVAEGVAGTLRGELRGTLFPSRGG
jgi:hypothetical protein